MAGVDCEMRQILAEMELLSYGSTANWEPATSSGERTYGIPPGCSFAAHDLWRRRYESATYKVRVVERAREALEAMRKQKRLEVEPETEAELEARIVSEGVGWGLQDIANHCRVTPKMARRARERLNVDVETGKPCKAPRRPLTERQLQAQALKARGLTLKQIGVFLGVDTATVSRDLATC